MADIIKVLYAAFDLVGSYLYQVVAALLAPLLAAIADYLTKYSGISAFKITPELVLPYLAVLNAWVPVDFGFTLYSAYWFIEGIVLVFRFFKKLAMG
jgi:hypothetical protein